MQRLSLDFRLNVCAQTNSGRMVLWKKLAWEIIDVENNEKLGSMSLNLGTFVVNLSLKQISLTKHPAGSTKVSLSVKTWCWYTDCDIARFVNSKGCRFQTPVRGNSARNYIMVVELINLETRQWNRNTL